MFHLNRKTLAYFKSKPLVKQVDLSKVNTTVFASRVREYVQTCGLRHPESEALYFYLGNHAYGELTNRKGDHEILNDNELAMVKWYFETAEKVALRLVNYVALIITRESRHVHYKSPVCDKICKEFGNEVGEVYRDFLQNMPTGSSSSAEYFMSTPPDLPLGAYCNMVAFVFNKGSFGSGYGGKPWGKIATTLARFVEGKLSLEAFADTAFTLAHNNGPMFNKGIAYHHQDNSSLLTILDVQRSGQIPNLISDWDNYGKYALTGMTIEHSQALREHSEFFEEAHIDWYKVEALGAKKSYSTFKAIQKKLTGPEAKLEKESEKFFVSPEDYVFIVERKSA